MINETIAHYRITGKLGEGGMGEVWRAFDTRLKREVALKLLPESFANDADRMARFQREAELLAALNHPNIAAIYGVEERALVMELVEGETLHGPMSLDQALAIADQIADALSAAHERGIIHRDLKPANIMITQSGVVKLLDFGLAKAVEEKPGDASVSPTMTMSPTRAGMILGTAAYMAPEQARGKAVDRRADIWAFGCVLYEMFTGKQAFAGETVSDIIASVLAKEPDLAATPAKIRRLLKKCLEKDPRQRLQAIGDWKLLLDEAPESESKRTNPWRWVIAFAVLIALISASIVFVLFPRPVSRPMMRFTDDLGLDGPPSAIAISPDGMRLAFVGPDQRLYVRFLDSPKAMMLPGTDGASVPFFSPDGAWIGFGAGGVGIKKVAVHGGAPVTLCESVNMIGASWTEDGHIIFALGRGGLMRVSDSGGNPEALTKLDQKKGEVTHRSPQALPGGRSVLYTSWSAAGFEDGDIVVQAMSTGERKTIYHGGYLGQYLASGHLIYMHEGTLFAAPMDLKRLELTGSPVPVLDDVEIAPISGEAMLALSQSGTLAYLPAASAQLRYLAWLDASGKIERMNAPARAYLPQIAISPDGAKVAVGIEERSYRNLWIYDSTRDRLIPLTSVKGVAQNPTWEPDGRHLVFSVSGPRIFRVRSDGAGRPEELLDVGAGSGGNTATSFSMTSFTPDGKRMAFMSAGGIAVVDLDSSDPEHPKPRKPENVLAGPGRLAGPSFSPDGHWLAYVSLGPPEVYVTQFPGPGGRWLISDGGGYFPVWSRNGRELFYQRLDGRIMAVRYVAKAGSFEADPPRVWSDRALPRGTHGLAPDGRVAIAIPAEEKREKPASHVVFLLNFFDELKRRVPGK